MKNRTEPARVENVALISIGMPSDTRVFTLSEAWESFELIRRITGDAFDCVQPVRRRMQRMVPADPRLPMQERAYTRLVQRWQSHMMRLGVVVRGLWMVDFDTGDGFLSWRYPELKIGQYHRYGEDFSERRALAKIIEELDPDWAHA